VAAPGEHNIQSTVKQFIIKKGVGERNEGLRNYLRKSLDSNPGHHSGGGGPLVNNLVGGERKRRDHSKVVAQLANVPANLQSDGVSPQKMKSHQ
jgi:hypothetical protein